MQNKTIVIAGGSGFVGHGLCKFFGKENRVIVLTRNNHLYINNADNSLSSQYATLLEWDGKHIGNWATVLDGSDLLINLAGKSVNCRYTDQNKKEIFDSRVNATSVLGKAIQKCEQPPTLWINASSATIYRYAMDKPQDEFTGEYHNDFSVQVCKLWEKTFFEQIAPETRKIALRMAITLGDGGVMSRYVNLCRIGLGGKQGSGKQIFSWIHIEDICNIISFLYEQKNAEGIFNASSPNPVSNSVFMQSLRKINHTSFGLPAHKWMLKFGAWLIGTETELLLKSRWVLPTKLLQQGYVFKHPQLEEAFTSLIG
jgi:uncharacterized protein (TIGR01777 family)